MYQNRIILRYSWLPRSLHQQFRRQQGVAECVQDLSDIRFHIVIISSCQPNQKMTFDGNPCPNETLKTSKICKTKYFNIFNNSMFNIALNTFREIIRNKFFGLIAFLGIIFILLSFVLDTLALGEARRVLFDFGLSFIEITGLAIVLFLGGGMIAREIEWRTIYLMLSKPVRRGMIILGKFTGFSLVISAVVVLEMLILLSVLLLKGLYPDMLFFFAIAGIWFKLEAMLALILFFSTWVSPMIAMFMTITSYIIWHSGYVVLDYAMANQSFPAQIFARTLLATFPNLSALNLKNYVATDAIIASSSIGTAFVLGGLYIFCILYLSVYIFERKSFDAV